MHNLTVTPGPDILKMLKYCLQWWKEYWKNILK